MFDKNAGIGVISKRHCPKCTKGETHMPKQTRVWSKWKGNGSQNKIYSD